ncbi:hypothetical protein MJH12_08215, partial [bacterium]|nr:hypothetical protein [bacterium]
YSIPPERIETLRYTHSHHLESTASILYDVSVYFQDNMIAFNLETRKLSIEFDQADKDQVHRKLILTENYTPFPVKSFQIYYEKTKHIIKLLNKSARISNKLELQTYKRFSASYKKVGVYLILEKVLRTMEFPCLLSNRVTGEMTLHLSDVNSFEVLAYIMDAHDLTFLTLDGSCLIKPINQ